MTTNSEGSQPNPGKQTTDDAAIAAAAAAAQQTLAPAEPDIDQQEIDAAKAAVEAEKAAGGGDGTQAADTGTQGQKQPGQQDQQQPAAQAAPAGDAPLIPKARLDEALRKADEEKANAAYWKGVADARVAPKPQDGQTQPAQQQQQPTAEQRLAVIQTEQDALAKKFDDGEITMSDLTRQQRELNNREHVIREEALLARVKPADKATDQQLDNTLYLDTLTAQLEQQHPWVEVFDKTVGDKSPEWKYVKDRAVQNCIDRGIDPTKPGTGQYELRKEFSVLADQLGPSLVGDRAKTKGIAIPGQTPSQGGQQQQKSALSPQAQARAAALTKQENAPPNLQRMSGATDDGTGVPSDSRLEHMSDDEIGNLPDAARRKLLGITAA
jgi:hypothetical protein